MSETVLYERDGAVAIITLNRPESLNSMNAELLNTLHVLGAKASEDPEVRAVVITGTGRAFCAGGDIKGMADRRAADPNAPRPVGLVDRADVLRRQEEISRHLYEMPKPTIAAINGHAVGAGLSVALSADFRIASENAKFGTAFARVGFSGDFGGTWLLQRYVGPGRAKELYLNGETLDAAQALALGLLTKVVPHETLMGEALALARRLAAGPTLAYGRMKQNIAYGATNTLADTLTLEAENMVASARTEDHKEAARAFVEKRDPVFTAR